MKERKKNYRVRSKDNFGLDWRRWRVSYRNRDARLCAQKTFSTRRESALLLCATGLSGEFYRNRCQLLMAEATWLNTQARLSAGPSLLGGSVTAGGPWTGAGGAYAGASGGDTGGITMNSTRRLRSRPSGVRLGAIG